MDTEGSLIERLTEVYGPLLLADGFDDCVIGVARVRGEYVLCYSTAKIIESLVNQGMDYEEAWEYYEFNIGCAYVGEQTPIFVNELEEL